MNFPRQNEKIGPLLKAVETLRLVATLPAPDGLVERVQAKVRTAPRAFFLRRAFAPALDGWMFSPALRGAAAAAIVCLVAGGGWRIYSHVQQPPPTIVAAPARIGSGGGFSSAGAMRTPDTLNGPVLTHAIAPTPKTAAPACATTQEVTHASKDARAATHRKKSAIPSQ